MRRIEGVKALIFDFGGTLDLDGIHWLNAFYLLYEKFSLPPSQSAIKEVFYRVDRILETIENRRELRLEQMIKTHVRLQLEMHGIESTRIENAMADEFCYLVKQNFKKNRALLEKLKSRYKLGLVSNFYGNVATLCEEAGFSPFLDVIIDSDEVGLRKPDPEIFRLALDRLKEKPRNTAFVGDSFSQDIRPAKSVGMKTIWLKTRHTAPFPDNWEEFTDATINTLAKLEEILS